MEPEVTALYSSELIWVKMRLHAELTAKNRQMQITPSRALMFALNDLCFAPTLGTGKAAWAQSRGVKISS